MGKRKSKKRKDTEAAVRAMADFCHALGSEEFCHALCNEIIWWGNAFNDSLRALQGKENQGEGGQS